MTSKSEMKPKQGISRRTVVKGTAWAVPAVVVASAAPAMAAGASVCVTATFGGQSCKQPGTGQNEWGYQLEFCFTNNCLVPVTIDVISVQGNSGSAPLQPVDLPSITLQPGQTGCVPGTVDYCSKNSANFINVTFTVNGATNVQSVPSPPQDCVPGQVLCT